MKVKIKDILPNPFRHIDRYPIRADKVAALIESIQTTGFWDNLVARPGPTPGTAEIAYGHHRRAALLQAFDPDHEVNLIVRDLDDEQMLKIMARENMEEWGTSAAVEHETVRAVVEAYAKSRVKLEPPDPSTNTSQLRYAPGFITGDAGQQAGARPYTAFSVAKFLGWMERDKETQLPTNEPQDKVMWALSALEFVESGALDEDVFRDLTTMQAQAVVEQARKAKALAEAHAREEARRREEARKAAERHEQERRRQAAEAADRERRAAEAKRERDRRAHEQAAAQARKAAAQAQRDREAAQDRQQRAAAREAALREEARQAAETVGRDVGNAMRRGEGYKNAWKVAQESQPEVKRPPVEIDAYARRMANRIHELLDNEYHALAKQLDELLKFRAHLGPEAAQALRRELSALSARADGYRERLAHPASGVPDAQPDMEILDAEVVSETVIDPRIKEIQ